MARAGRIDKAVEEQFLHELYRGGELLAAGKVIEAKDHLERAYKLQPRNEKGQNLLGLTYFKLGLFDRAAEIYEALVRENPADPTLRVNLGLVYLKTNALKQAIREFETATDLFPEHKKAHNYLGLALAQAGEYGRAREHFLLAGSEAMAEKMARALSGQSFSVPIPTSPARQKGFAEIEGGEAVSSPPPSPPAEEQIEVMEEEAGPPPEEEAAPSPRPAEATPLSSSDWGAQFGLDAPPRAPSAEATVQVVEDVPPTEGEPVERPMEVAVEKAARAADETPIIETTPEDAEPEEAPAVAPVPQPPPSPPARVEAVAPPARASAAKEAEVSPLRAGTATPVLADWAARVQLSTDGSAGPFQVGDEAVAMRVQGELLARVSGLVAWSGSLELRPERKRFRGRVVDKPFGEGERQLARLFGDGTVFVARREQTFTVVDLDDESAYFREECVFAFEEPVVFENGRLTADVPDALELVHLRGKGRVLLETAGPIRSLAVRMERPVTVPLVQLVGWHGNVTPRLLALPQLRGSGVELSGEGFALFAVAAR